MDMSKVPSEHAEQVCFVKWCKLNNIFIHAIENSLQFVVPDNFPPKIKSTILTIIAKIVKDRKEAGQVNGVPDLFIPELKLYVEMKKTIGGVVSERQRDVHKILRQKGYNVEVAYGAKNAADIVLRYKNEI